MDGLDEESGAGSSAPEMSAEDLALARGDVIPVDGDDDSQGSAAAEEDSSLAAGDSGSEEDQQEEEQHAEDGEDEGEDEGEDAKEEKHGEEAIPRPRFDQVIAQRNEARQKLEDLESQNRALMQVLQKAQQQGDVKPDTGQGQKDAGQADAFDLQTKLRQYSEAVVDGEDEVAAAAMNEILQYQQRQAQEAAQQAVNTYAAGLDQTKAQDVASEIYARNESAFASEETVSDFLAWRDIYRNRGMSMQQALAQAEAKLFGKSEDTSSGQDKGKARDMAKTDQKKKAVERNAQAAAGQPPAMSGGSGQRSRSIPKTALDMSDTDYDKLSSEEKARARGDIAA